MTTPSQLALALLCSALACSNPASAADYPTRPVRIVVPYTPGGAVDVISRAVGEKLSSALGQPVVMENRPGAGASLGAEIVAKSAPDGYTLFVCTVGAMTINVGLYKDLRYNPLKDFDGVSLLANHSMGVVVNNDLPVKTVAELVDYARSRPGGISGGHPGNGTSAHLAMAFFNKTAGIKISPVPYRASTAVTAAVASGELPMSFIDLLPAMPHAKAGRLRIIGVVGPDRSALAPEVPTMEESGFKGFDFVTWSGFFAPAGTPREILARLNQEIRRIIADPEMRKRILALGGEPTGSTPEEPVARVRREMAMWTSLVRDAGAKVD